MQNNKETKSNFALQIHECLDENLQGNPKFMVMGLGVNDPKGVFGTTTHLSNKYGNNRVIETPTSENAMTGIGVGLAISGYRPLMVHQRLDFFLLAMDQLVNSAAKWHYMFGGQQSVPITIRLIIGRGWGQGPTHSQNLHAWFTHIPGLKVVMPAFAGDVKQLLQSSIDDPNPVLFIEDRWCHVQEVNRSEIRNTKLPLGKAEVVKEGLDVTIVSAGFSTIQSLRAVSVLEKNGIQAELIDLKSLKPLDLDTIAKSIQKTGRLLVVDSGSPISSFASEIISLVSREYFSSLKQAPQMITAPDVPEPTSYGVIGDFKFDSSTIATAIGRMLRREVNSEDLEALRKFPVDVPNSDFMGPF
jgi:pyruvate/2-oxoglutarate/acetoin dehydrogenase E1 component